MKKTILFAAAALMLSSCAPTARMSMLINTATSKQVVTMQPVAALFADVEVSPKKIMHMMIPSRSVKAGGYDNVINSAVREALEANGEWDLIVCLDTQVKYNEDGDIETVVVTGYPAKYVNFRSPGDEYLKKVGADVPAPSSQKGGVGSVLPFGKK